MADSVYIFDGAVRQEDSEFQLVFRSFTDGSLDFTLPPVSILWMNPLAPLFPRRHTLFWIEAKYAIPLVGKMQGASSLHLPDPTPGMRQPLGFFKVRLAVLQSFIERA